jgi:WhiB family redox-sensing transcriptional regulator
VRNAPDLRRTKEGSTVTLQMADTLAGANSMTMDEDVTDVSTIDLRTAAAVCSGSAHANVPTGIPSGWSDPAASLDPLAWQAQALCAQTDPEAFFPEKGGSVREAKRTCLSCDVRAECLDFALMNDERFGIWGGLSERERRQVRRAAI